MAKQDAKPYKEGATWSMRRRLFGQELFVSGRTTSAAAKKEMAKMVLALEVRGKPKGFGPRKTTLGQALQDMGIERLPFMKGAKQEANRFNRYLRAAGLATLQVKPWVPVGEAQAGPDGVDKNGKGQLYLIELEPPKPKRTIPRGLASHRSELERQTAQAEALRAGLARMTFSDVQAYRVQDFLDAIRKASRMPATLQLERAVLRGLFNYAAKVWRWSEPAGNPAVGLRLPQVNNGRDRVMSADEERRLDEAVQDCHNHLVGPTLTLLTETAMRSSEPLQYARWKDVDWQANELRLRDSKTDSRDVPLSPKAIQALRELERLNPGGPDDRIVSMSYEALKAAWKRACERAGISDLRVHDLRHTAVTRMALKSGNIFIVKVMHAPEPAQAASTVAPPVPVGAITNQGAPEPSQTQQVEAVDVVGNLVRVNFGKRRVA